MKRVIRKRGSLLYLGSNGEWTTDLCLAITFENVSSALWYWETNCAADAEYVVIMGNSPSEEDDLSLPLLPRKSATKQEHFKVPGFIPGGLTAQKKS
jgi:hypothetical protein